MESILAVNKRHPLLIMTTKINSNLNIYCAWGSELNSFFLIMFYSTKLQWSEYYHYLHFIDETTQIKMLSNLSKFTYPGNDIVGF